MNRGDLLVSLITSFIRDDKDGFVEDCNALIQYEESKKNFRIANQMRKALEEGGKSGKPSLTPSSFAITPIETKRGIKSLQNKSDIVNLEKSYVDLDKITMSNLIKNSITSLIDQWENTKELARYNLTPQNRILFHGPPGTGKTFTAYGIANKLGYDIAYIPFDSLVSSYLGQTGSNIKEVFEFSSKNPCILLLDEIDAIGKKRDDQQELGELKRVVISLLQNLDKFPANSLLIACTNHPHLLDEALWRRFDCIIKFDYPEKKERCSIIESQLLALNLKIDKGWIEFWADVSEGLSPAILVQLIENGIRKWVVNRRESYHLKVTEELIQYLDLENTPEEIRVDIARKLRNHSRLYTFSYLSSLLNIPKSTLHKRLKEQFQSEG